LSIFTHRDGRVLDTVCQQHSRDIQYMYQYKISISAPTISTSFDFRDPVHVKGRLMCVVLFPNIVKITMCFFFVAIPCHTSPSMHFNIMNEVVNESLRKICHYPNVPQHYYLLDTLVSNLISTAMELIDLIDIQRVRHTKLRKFTFTLKIQNRLLLIAKDLTAYIKSLRSYQQ